MFSDPLNETKGFKYQITLRVTLKKYNPNGEIRIYFNATTKTVINQNFGLGNAFPEVLYLFDNWINEGSGLIVESIDSQYINISTYRPLSGSPYVKLPVELRIRRKRLINIKHKDQKYFLWCHVRHINPVEIHPARIIKADKKLVRHNTNPEKITQEGKESVSDLDYDEIEFPFSEKDFS